MSKKKEATKETQDGWYAAGYDEWTKKIMPDEPKRESFACLAEFALSIAEHTKQTNLDLEAREKLLEDFDNRCSQAEKFINGAQGKNQNRVAYLVSAGKEWMENLRRRVKDVLFANGSLESWPLLGNVQYELLGLCAAEVIIIKKSQFSNSEAFRLLEELVNNTDREAGVVCQNRHKLQQLRKLLREHGCDEVVPYLTYRNGRAILNLPVGAIFIK